VTTRIYKLGEPGDTQSLRVDAHEDRIHVQARCRKVRRDGEPAPDGSAGVMLTYEQAQELHRALGIALGDERVRRAELARKEGKGG
jgi:hypothetical protein